MEEKIDVYAPLTDQTFNAIRSDLWDTMTLDDLTKQQEVLLSRLTKARQMRVNSAAQVIAALEQGYNAITARILQSAKEKE